MSTNDLPNGSSAGTIDVDVAKQYAENWRTYLATSKQEFKVRSYHIPIESYRNILNNNPTAEAVRVYIGLLDANDPTTSQVLLVPIVDGRELLYQGTDPNGVGGPESNVYDLSKPCPPTCGDGGPDDDTLDK